MGHVRGGRVGMCRRRGVYRVYGVYGVGSRSGGLNGSCWLLLLNWGRSLAHRSRLVIVKQHGLDVV